MINFSKMHSLGNDFMVIDAISETVTLKPEHIARPPARYWF
jgi:diaminopimelate epimerase